jgi:hypothetical protein
VGFQPLEPDQGSLREALTSLHSLFATTRDLLRRVADEAGPPLALPAIASRLLNQHLRPFLSTWHPALDAYEAERTSGSATEHERNWERAAEMRKELTALREPLTAVARELATVCGIDLAPPP